MSALTRVTLTGLTWCTDCKCFLYDLDMLSHHHFTVHPDQRDDRLYECRLCPRSDDNQGWVSMEYETTVDHLFADHDDVEEEQNGSVDDELEQEIEEAEGDDEADEQSIDTTEEEN